ncbi:ATP-dependent DNA helicase RecQ [bacterium BMS3Bbin10]|nr:ATP-dependent DNA helicase RecQ [bacterium BMS3Bbin10]
MNQPADKILHDVFGYGAFRPGQEEIVDLLTSGKNALVVMPTGAGKSLCYQIPALLSDRLTIVVSPLVALMDDQVAALRANGVAAASVHSGLSREEQIANWRSVSAGDCRLLYLSPERLMTSRMLDAVAKLDPALLVVDEAHCISKWGVSFRPEYERLSGLRERFPHAAIAAFTATADKATRADIAQKLFKTKGQIIVHGFDRPNLMLGVAPKEKWKAQLLEFLENKRDDAGIVYCLSRKYTEEVAEFLTSEGFNAIAYHAGQDSQLRRTNQNRFMSENAVIMVATIAFGMGIDKPDIRYVCHLNLPASMEAYYQEIGRAGRDGLPAQTLLLYGLADLRLRRQFIEQDSEDQAHKLREHKRLDALLAYCDAPACRRTALLAYFDEEAGPCGNCDNCLNPPRMIDGTHEAQMLLAAIRDTGQMFGGAHIIDVLRGASTEKILARRHDKLGTYGAGAAHPKPYWQAVIRQAVAGTYLAINIEKYGALQITARGRAVASGEEGFALREIDLTKPAKAAKTAKKPKGEQQPVAEGDQDLLAALKTLRLEFARTRNVPAFVVFHDATLLEMARERPATLEQMATINGVGPAKLENFGEAFLKAIAAQS